LVSENIFVIATASLAVEIIAFSLLFFGYHQKRLRKFRKHGVTMTIAVALHLVVIFSWMIASFVNIFLGAAPLDFDNILMETALTHVALGTIAVSLGVWLVGAWRLQANVQGCFGRKRLMLTTIIIWSAAMALGVFLYAVVVTS
jgi:hypothetical protein